MLPLRLERAKQANGNFPLVVVIGAAKKRYFPVPHAHWFKKLYRKEKMRSFLAL